MFEAAGKYGKKETKKVCGKRVVRNGRPVICLKPAGHQSKCG